MLSSVPSQSAALPADAPSPASLKFLDGLRGLAALYVVVGHARWLLWEGYSAGYVKHPEAYSPFNTALVYFLSIFKFGQWAVLFFFVLSGFVIHLNYARKLNDADDATFDWKTFFLKRCRRLYPPLLLSMLLTWIVDAIGTGQHYAIYTLSTPYQAINQAQGLMPSHSPTAFLGNLCFLMTANLWGLHIPTWGSDGPLWSLHWEWWFYMLYPIFWKLSKRSIGLATGVMLLMLFASFFDVLWLGLFLQDIFKLMSCWWIGVLLADVYAGRIRVDPGRLAWLILLIVAVPAAQRLLPVDGPSREVITSVLLAMAFAGMISLCLWWQSRGRSLWMLDRLKPLGDMSYSLYVTHLPILVLLSGWLMSRSPDSTLPAHFGWVAAGIALTLPIAYGSYRLVEKPMGRRCG